MSISEKVAYLKGLAEGMELNKETNEGKMLFAIVDVLNEIAESIDGLEFDMDVVSSDINDLDDEIGYLYEEYEDEDCGCGGHHGHCGDDDYDDYEGDIYEVTCPKCGEVVLLDEDTLDEGEINCYKCGEKIEIDFDGLFEDDEKLNLNIE